MFLVIFASINQGHGPASARRDPVQRLLRPGILAYGVIGTTYVNMAISTAILRDEGVLKRMQGTPLPSWGYVAARIGSTVLIVGAITVGDARDRRDRLRSRRPRVDAPRAGRDAGPGNRGVHDAGGRDHPVHLERRRRSGDRQPDRAAADVHLGRLVPDRRDAEALQIAKFFPIKRAGRRASVRLQPAHGRRRIQRDRRPVARDLDRRRGVHDGAVPATAARRGDESGRERARRAAPAGEPRRLSFDARPRAWVSPEPRSAGAVHLAGVHPVPAGHAVASTAARWTMGSRSRGRSRSSRPTSRSCCCGAVRRADRVAPRTVRGAGRARRARLSSDGGRWGFLFTFLRRVCRPIAARFGMAAVIVRRRSRG